MGNEKLLEVKNLKTYFNTDFGLIKAVDDVSLTINKSTIRGIVGESGCGKSVTARSILRLVTSPGKIVGGEILFHQDNKKTIDLAKLPHKSSVLQKIRGEEIAMVFQEPMTAFSPVYTIGNQIMEAILLHQKVSKQEARTRAIEMLKKVGIPNAGSRIDEYPHQLSGGMRQRAMIAMALSCNPKLLIADEPTTALDVTIQAQIIELMQELQKDFQMSIMIITHDLGIVAEMAENVTVMYLGKVVEEGTKDEIIYNPQHPYTRDLIKSIPKVETKKQDTFNTIEGSVPDPLDLPSGCYFHNRCSRFKEGLCDLKMPPLNEVYPDHKVRCFLDEVNS